MTEQEIEELKKELILLRMRNQRLESDIKKYQSIIRDILIGEINTETDTEEVDSVESESNRNIENPA